MVRVYRPPRFCAKHTHPPYIPVQPALIKGGKSLKKYNIFYEFGHTWLDWYENGMHYNYRRRGRLSKRDMVKTAPRGTYFEAQ
jgi:hypothetical protein